MTQEEKAKRYDEAIEIARKINSGNGVAAPPGWTTCEVIFPELKKSEDEKMKRIISDILLIDSDEIRKILDSNNVLLQDIDAWLEKQDSHYTFEIKKGYWYKCVCDYMLNGSDLIFKNDRLYYCRSDWRLGGEIDERNVKDIGVNGYKSFFRPATNQEIKDWLEKQGNLIGDIQEANKKIGELVEENHYLKEERKGKIILSPEAYERVLKLGEKQGEQKPVVIPKFRVGDIIKLKDSDETYEVSKIEIYDADEIYYYLTNGGCICESSDNFELVKQKPTDKVEPKFKVGDIIKDTEDGEVFTVRTITKDKYIYTDDSFDWIKDQDEYELVEQKPAEDIDLPEFESYLCLMFQKFRAKGMCTNGEIIDYVKEHSQKLRDILVKPAWSEEDEKMLNNAISACNHCYFQDTIEWLKSLKERVQPQPKQGWSEEDETKIKSIIALLKSPALCTMDGNKGIIDESIKYLKSLKGRVQPRPQQELSMYDETILKSLIAHFEYKKEFNEAEDYDVVLWLKSLKDRYIWKPSDEQMIALQEAMNIVGILTITGSKINSLYQDLKKLREE